MQFPTDAICLPGVEERLALGQVSFIEEMADIAVCGDRFTRFGTAFVATDMDGDGVVDLAVGEPYAGYGELAYGGAVRVFHGYLREGGERGGRMQGCMDSRRAGSSGALRPRVASAPAWSTRRWEGG